MHLLCFIQRLMPGAHEGLEQPVTVLLHGHRQGRPVLSMLMQGGCQQLGLHARVYGHKATRSRLSCSNERNRHRAFIRVWGLRRLKAGSRIACTP